MAGSCLRTVQEANEVYRMLGLVAAEFGGNLTLGSVRNLKRPGGYRSMRDQKEGPNLRGRMAARGRILHAVHLPVDVVGEASALRRVRRESGPRLRRSAS